MGWAVALLTVLLVATVTSGDGSVLKGLHEGRKIGALADGAAEVDEAVHGFFLAVFVDESTGVDGGHVGAVERFHFFEFADVLVAAILGKARRLLLV